MWVILVLVLLFGFNYSSLVASKAEGRVEDQIMGMFNQQFYDILSGLGTVPTTTSTLPLWAFGIPSRIELFNFCQH